MAATRAVYDFSADAYVDAVGTQVSEKFEAPLDRATLDAFAEMVIGGQHSDESPLVLDVGCGTGRITSYLAARGLDVRGVDISEGMLSAARVAHPNLTFEEGSLDVLPVASASFDALTAWYSIIHTSLELLLPAWAEFARVLRPGGHLLLAFQAGSNEAVERPDAHGSSATLTHHRHQLSDVAAGLEAGGFEIRARVEREPELAHETTPQAFLVARHSSP